MGTQFYSPLPGACPIAAHSLSVVWSHLCPIGTFLSFAYLIGALLSFSLKSSIFPGLLCFHNAGALLHCADRPLSGTAPCDGRWDVSPCLLSLLVDNGG